MKNRFLSTLGVLALLSGSAFAQTTFSGGTGFTIPDAVGAVPGVASSTIAVAASPNVVTTFNSLTLRGLTHTWVGDLVITLQHGSTTIDILDRVGATTLGGVGSSGDLSGDFVFNLSGIVFPSANVNVAGASGPFQTFPNATAGGISPANGLLSSFIGASVAGNWTLVISDNAAGDTGALTSWEFNATVAAAPEPGSLALLSLVAVPGVALLRRRRK